MRGVEEALDKGYECTEIRTLITEESVTTETQAGWSGASGDMSEYISAAEIVVTFDGVEYTAIKTNDEYGAPWSDELGAPDWSEYPFSIFENQITTENAGTYSVKIEALEETIETSECFRDAVNSVIPTPKFLGVRGLYASGIYDKFNYSVREIFDVIKNGGSASVAIMNSAYSGARTVYQLHRIESDDTDVVYMGDLGDITKVYFVAHDGSQISASIVNGEDRWASESNA